MANSINELTQLNSISGKHHASSPRRRIRLVNTNRSYITVTVRWIKDEGYILKGVLTLMSNKAGEPAHIDLFNSYMLETIDEVLPTIQRMADNFNKAMGTNFRITGGNNGKSKDI